MAASACAEQKRQEASAPRRAPASSRTQETHTCTHGDQEELRRKGVQCNLASIRLLPVIGGHIRRGRRRQDSKYCDAKARYERKRKMGSSSCTILHLPAQGYLRHATSPSAQTASCRQVPRAATWRDRKSPNCDVFALLEAAGGQTSRGRGPCAPCHCHTHRLHSIDVIPLFR